MIRRRKYHLLAVILIVAVSAWVGRRWLLSRVFASQMSGPVYKPPVVADDILVVGFDGPIQETGLPTPWQSRTIIGKLDFDMPPLDDSDHKAFHFHCEKSHAVVYAQVDPFDPNHYPIITWKWKGLALPTNGDARTHSAIPHFGDNRNDEVLQVLIAFESKETLNYGWDTSAPVGTEMEEWSPVTKLQMRVVESGTDHLNEWQEYRVNILEDFQRRYGKPPGKVIGVSFQTNCNHTGTVSEAVMGPIVARTH
jgi:hypothetical protein